MLMNNLFHFSTFGMSHEDKIQLRDDLVTHYLKACPRLSAMNTQEQCELNHVIDSAIQKYILLEEQYDQQKDICKILKPEELKAIKFLQLRTYRISFDPDGSFGRITHLDGTQFNFREREDDAVSSRRKRSGEGVIWNLMPQPIYKIFAHSAEECPEGMRRLTFEEVASLKPSLELYLEMHDTIKLDGGKISRYGCECSMEVGVFDGGWGWVFVTADGNGISIDDHVRALPNPCDVKKIFINGAHECPKGMRRLTLEEAKLMKASLLPLMGEWDIIKLDGGKIDGYGYGNNISPGEFDGGWGWVFATKNDNAVSIGDHVQPLKHGRVLPNPCDIKKIFINGAHECPKGMRRLTLKEAKRMKASLLPLMDEWDIIKLDGGKIDGYGYGNNISPGEFDGGWGWVFATKNDNVGSIGDHVQPLKHGRALPKPCDIKKIFINGAHECPKGMRRLTLKEAKRMKASLLPLMDEWDIIKLDGGKIDGYGYGNNISPGEFDGGWGWVFATQNDNAVSIGDHVQPLKHGRALPNPCDITKIFINGAHECPKGMRRLTLEEATMMKASLLPLMDEWDIIKLDGGKIDGYGYGNNISPGEFDGGWGWVFATNDDNAVSIVKHPALPDPSDIKKIFINDAHECPNGMRRLTLEEAEKLKPSLLPLLGEWDIIKLDGGKIDGRGYGNGLHEGQFDGGWGWVFLVVDRTKPVHFRMMVGNGSVPLDHRGGCEAAYYAQLVSILIELVLLAASLVGSNINPSKRALEVTSCQIAKRLMRDAALLGTMRSFIKDWGAVKLDERPRILFSVLRRLISADGGHVTYDVLSGLDEERGSCDVLKVYSEIIALVLVGCATGGLALLAQLSLALDEASDFLDMFANLEILSSKDNITTSKHHISFF